MTISELAARAELPVATVKFYLRDGLLPPGVATSATRATYDESHVQRLRLIRALVGVGGLSLAAVRDVLVAVDDPRRSTHDVLGEAHHRTVNASVEPDRASADRVHALLEQLNWRVHPQSLDRRALAGALAASASVGHPISDDVLETYARAALEVAATDVAQLPEGDRAAAVEMAVVSTVLRQPLLLALRRLAQEHISAARFS